MILDFSQNGIDFLFEVYEDNKIALKQFSNGTGKVSEDKKLKWCPAVEVQLSGENQDDHHGAKHTGTYGGMNLRYKSHKYYENMYGNKLELELVCEKIEVVAHYQFYNNISCVRAWTTVKNICGESIGLDYVSSFAYTGLEQENAVVYIPHNSWDREVNWKKNTLSELGYDRLDRFSMKRIFVSNTGTWATKEHLPLAAYQTEGSCIMWQIENNGSWQWEISDIADMLYLKLGGPESEANHWHKELAPNETFESVKACIALGETFDNVLEDMTAYRRIIFENNEPNKKLPVIFNDYMNCLCGDPTEEKVIALADKAAAAGAEYFCMDAGWYADGTWWETVGEWEPCEWRFPNGIKYTLDYIKSKGMIPGLWLEIEAMGIECPILDRFEDDCFFMRYGRRVIDHGRYQLDFRNKKVRDFAMSVIDRVVGEYGVGYIKMDYNIEAGSGTEVNSDSFGDGLLEHNRAYLCWIDEVKAKYPELIIENCGSGGMRMEYAMLSKHHLQSTSDQEDYKGTAYIAASAPTVVLPEQAAVWSYPLADADCDTVAFNMISALLQRIHLSGDLANLADDKFALVKEGIDCYKSIREDIVGAVPFYPMGLPMFGDDWICVAFRHGEKVRAAVWKLNSERDTVKIPLDTCGKEASVLYPSYEKSQICKNADGVEVTLPNKYSAILFEVK